MPNPKNHLEASSADGPLSIEELEAGLHNLMDGTVDQRCFWQHKILAFRQTLLFAIRETSDALLSPTISPRWRAELEQQLPLLLHYYEFANCDSASEVRPSNTLPH